MSKFAILARCGVYFFQESSSKGISSFQALAVSLSGRVGTGNIAGVAAAIGFGGPGAVFWMWVVAFFGAATSLRAESTLAQIYKEEDNGEFRGGPAYYIEKAMGQKMARTSSQSPLYLLVVFYYLVCNQTVSAMPLKARLAQAW